MPGRHRVVCEVATKLVLLVFDFRAVPESDKGRKAAPLKSLTFPSESLARSSATTGKVALSRGDCSP